MGVGGGSAVGEGPLRWLVGPPSPPPALLRAGGAGRAGPAGAPGGVRLCPPRQPVARPLGTRDGPWGEVFADGSARGVRNL